MGDNNLKLICEYPPGSLRNATTVNDINVVSIAIRTMPGIGKPFLIYSSLPGLVAAADFDLHPEYVVSANEADNKAMINAMLANPPLDALTFV